MDKFLLNTDHPIDKVVFKYSGTHHFSTSGYEADVKTFDITHSLPFKPLIVGTFSDNNWATSFELNAWDFWYSSQFNEYGVRLKVMAWAEANKVFIGVTNFDAPRNIAFKAVGIAPPDLPKPTNIGSLTNDNFMLNTDYDYMKIYKQGVTTINTDTSGSNKTKIIHHGLGYAPNCLVFVDWQGKVMPIGSTGFLAKGKVNSQNLVIEYENYTVQNIKIIYKIYLN